VDTPAKVKTPSPTYAKNPPQIAAASTGFAMPPADAVPPADATASTAVSKDLPIQIPGASESSIAMGTPTPTAPLTTPGKTKQNKFVLPEGAAPSIASDAPTGNLGGLTLPANSGSVVSASVSATLAGARNSSMGLPSDGKEISRSVEAKPELAIQGFCAVSVVNDGQWVEGKPELGVIHLGKLYLFSDTAAMELFLADPIPFTPMLNEIDVVRFFEEKKIVQGKREWGVIDPVHNRMFFFADEAAMLHFEQEFSRYLDASIQVMDTAIKESNPGA
jgi:protein disulfide-isomerase